MHFALCTNLYRIHSMLASAAAALRRRRWRRRWRLGGGSAAAAVAAGLLPTPPSPLARGEESLPSGLRGGLCRTVVLEILMIVEGDSLPFIPSPPPMQGGEGARRPL